MTTPSFFDDIISIGLEKGVIKLNQDNIVVYEDDSNEIPYIVIETKSESTKYFIEMAQKEGLGNASLLNSKFLLIVCGVERYAYDVTEQPLLKTIDRHLIAEIPVKYGKVPTYKYVKGDPKWDLRKLGYAELSNKFKLCHNEIWEGGKRDPAVAFDEISKLLLVKIYDERFVSQGSNYEFQVGTYESEYEVTERIKRIYRDLQNKEAEVFSEDIKIPNYVIFRIVEILQYISLIRTDLDSKGRAFENFLGRLFRGEYGQYFTPRQIVEFIVSIIDPTERETIIDPACGSGGFLLYSWKHLKNKIRESHRGDDRTITWLEYTFSHKQLYGIENY